MTTDRRPAPDAPRPTPRLRLAVTLLVVVFVTLFLVTTFVDSPEAIEAARTLRDLDGQPCFTEGQIQDGLRFAFQRRLIYWTRVALDLSLFVALACTGAGRKLADACGWLVGWAGPGAVPTSRLRQLLDLGRFLAVVLLVGAFVSLSQQVIQLPLRVVSVEHYRAWGMTDRTLSSWLVDYAAALAVQLVIGGGILMGLYLLLRWLPRVWWLAAASLSVALGAAFAWVLPVLINPLFNTFTPLKDPELNARFRVIADRAGVSVSEVLVMDASRQSRHSNAYFTGFGSTRRIVVYDNLLLPMQHAGASGTASAIGAAAGGPLLTLGTLAAGQEVQSRALGEVESILAHEVGHWLHNHIVQGLALAGLGAVPGFAAMAWLLRRAVGRAPFALRDVSDPAGVPLVLLLGFLGAWLALPVESAISRRFEREADRAALELARSPRAFIDSERRMAVDNLGNVAPAPFNVWLFATHPTSVERIRTAREWYERHGGEPAPVPGGGERGASAP